MNKQINTFIFFSCLAFFNNAYAQKNMAIKNTSETLNKLFSPDIINADLRYLESIIGVAKKTDYYFSEKHYSINGCNVTVGFNKNQQINYMGLDISSKCNFNLHNFVQINNKKNFPVSQLKFGQLGGEYYADCLNFLCGNAADPNVHEYYIGPRSQQNIEIIISSRDINYNNSKDIWSKAVRKNEGENSVIMGNYNCHPEKYKDLVKKYLSGLPTERILIGYNLKSSYFQHIEYHCKNYK